MKGLRNKVWGIEFERGKKKKSYLFRHSWVWAQPHSPGALFFGFGKAYDNLYFFKSPNYPSPAHTNFSAFLRTKPEHTIYI